MTLLFLYPQRVLSSLKEHAKAVLDPPKPHPASVTTYRTQNDTAAVWKRIFSYASVRYIVNICEMSFNQ